MVALSGLAAKEVIGATLNQDLNAVILPSPLTVAEDQSLNFGTFSTGGVGGTVVVDTAGLANYTGVVEIATTSPTEAVLKVIGNAGPNVILTITNPTFAVSNGTTTMQVNQFNINTNTGGVMQTLNMTAPTILVPVGATLTVGAAQPAGTYNGAFTLNAVYQ